MRIAGFGQRYLASRERRFAEEFGEQDYETARSEFERVVADFATE